MLFVIFFYYAVYEEEASISDEASSVLYKTGCLLWSRASTIR